MNAETEINSLLTQIQETYNQKKLYKKLVWIFLFLGFVFALIFFLLLVAKRKKLKLLKNQFKYNLKSSFTSLGIQKLFSFQKTYLYIINPKS